MQRNQRSRWIVVCLSSAVLPLSMTTHRVQTLPRTSPQRPSTAATLGRLKAQGRNESTGNSFVSTGLQGSYRLGAHVFGPDPEHNKYYNRTEHGTYLIREALNQRTGSLPAWA